MGKEFKLEWVRDPGLELRIERVFLYTPTLSNENKTIKP